MEFEWDENKRIKTLRERGIDFIDVIDIWDDSNRQERLDDRHDYNEDRIQTIGKLKFEILFVVYTERDYEDGEEVVRIISARKANRREVEQYYSKTFSYGAL